jgi:hypothetical protein
LVREIGITPYHRITFANLADQLRLDFWK